jgi:D-3-phosphoglycerate dehydrogenase / 2-oxoglutarate reductase
MTMDVLLASPIDTDAVGELDRRHRVERAFSAGPEALRSLLPRTEVLVFRSGVSLSRPVLDQASRLRLGIRAGSGLDNVDVDLLRSRGIRLVRIPGPGARAVAELTLALLLNVARNVSLADRQLRDGRWAKHELAGPLLKEKTLGVVGLGSIGTQVGRLGAAWGMRVCGCVENPSPARADWFHDIGISLVDCDTVLADADFVTIHVPLKESTRHMIDTGAFARMKPGGFVVNAARGGVVDEDALHAALIDGRVAGAALDVHETEGGGTPVLAELSNVVLTPHIGAMALDAQREIGRRVIALIDAFVDGRLEREAAREELVV